MNISSYNENIDPYATIIDRFVVLSQRCEKIIDPKAKKQIKTELYDLRDLLDAYIFDIPITYEIFLEFMEDLDKIEKEIYNWCNICNIDNIIP